MKFTKTLLILTSIFLISATGANAQFGKIINSAKSVLTGDEGGLDIGGGIKEALQVGVDDAVETLSQENGYLNSTFKVLIPDNAQKVISTVSRIPGFKNLEKDLILKMNQAAELAAKKAGPIFLQAIKEMTMTDAKNILMGEQDAATRYLEKTSSKALYAEFMPVIQQALNEVKARSLWNSAVTAYNKIPLKKKLNPDLDDHVNTKALEGMFGMIEKKETGIRTNTGLRTSPLLKKVFSKQD